MGKLTVSLGGSIYVVTFVDDYSRFLTLRLQKSDVLKAFQEFRAGVENLQRGLIGRFLIL